MKKLEELIYKNAELVEDLHCQAMAAPPNVKELVRKIDLNNRHLSQELEMIESRLKLAIGYIKSAHDLKALNFLEDGLERLKELDE